MTDNKKLSGSPDNKRIDIHDPNEVRNWTKALGVSKEQLAELVKAHGTSAAKIREHLATKKR